MAHPARVLVGKVRKFIYCHVLFTPPTPSVPATFRPLFGPHSAPFGPLSPAFRPIRVFRVIRGKLSSFASFTSVVKCCCLAPSLRVSLRPDSESAWAVRSPLCLCASVVSFFGPRYQLSIINYPLFSLLFLSGKAGKAGMVTAPELLTLNCSP